MNTANPAEKTLFEASRATLRDGRAVTLRAAVPDDAPAMLGYLTTSLPDYSQYVLTTPGEFDMTEVDERQWIQAQQENPGSLAMLALSGDEVVAMMDCNARADRRRAAHVGTVGMSSAKAYWGSGIGTAMMDRLVDWAEANPALGLLQLQVYADNERAIRLYRGCGFVQAGTIPRRTRFADGGTRDDVIMYRRVDGTLSDAVRPGDFCADLDGVVLRQVRYGDAECLFALYERNRERFRPWFRWSATVRSVGEVRGGIAEWIERLDSEGKVTAVLEEGRAILGMVYLTHHNKTDRRTELGYWVDQGQEGRGLVTRGCRALIGYAFETLGVNRIDITADVRNTPSQAVAERLGFTRESVIRQWLRFEADGGRLADVVNYRLLREDWGPASKGRAGRGSGGD